MNIEELGEFGLIDRIRLFLPPGGPDIIEGIGDDVAVLRGSGDQVWLATCDVQTEGSHFLRDAICPEDLGHKVLAINLSDIAATGGTPRYALISLGLPKELPVDFVDELYEGLRSEAEESGTVIVGGNISGSKLGIFIDVFLLGEAKRDDILLRSGAKPGDRILTTGRLGDAAAAVALLLDPALSTTEGYRQLARRRLHRPQARLREGRIIALSRKASAMTDISDGLAGDLGHICERSNVGARLYAARLPVAEENRLLARMSRDNEWHFALFGGEDYELLFTAPAEEASGLAAQITRETGLSVSNIGEITLAAEGRQLILPGGQAVALKPHAWDHFKKNPSEA